VSGSQKYSVLAIFTIYGKGILLDSFVWKYLYYQVKINALYKFVINSELTERDVIKRDLSDSGRIAEVIGDLFIAVLW
jgi:hypothetical protein